MAKDINLLLEVRGTGSVMPAKVRYIPFNENKGESFKANDSMNLPSPTNSGDIGLKSGFENSSPEISPNREVMFQSPSMEDNMVSVNFSDLHHRVQPMEESPRTDDHVSPYVSMDSFASITNN